MARSRIPIIVLVSVLSRIQCDPTSRYSNGDRLSEYGGILKPPPPPSLSNILPVPFHLRGERTQRQNFNDGYHYLPPPPPPPPQPRPNEFKLPAHFYKQYNFNFVPQPQPFTTSAPSLFQKVSNWLFPSQQTSSDTVSSHSSNTETIKKDCNPCNLVPWIPVIKYNLDANKVQTNLVPTYGPPSPTAYATQFRSHSYSSNYNQPQSLYGSPHQTYGAPSQSLLQSTTYGPPSPTHTVIDVNKNSLNSQNLVPSSSYKIPSIDFLNHSGSMYITPSATDDSSSYVLPNKNYGLSSNNPSLSGSISAGVSNYPSQSYNSQPISTPSYKQFTPNDYASTKNILRPNDVGIINKVEPIKNSNLPKFSQPTGFKNSYGEPIYNVYDLDITYPGTATAAESLKIKTTILPINGSLDSSTNSSFTLSNPAPFSLSRGRNIHTLQPVALPNLSVSPLPPIFNARPFRPFITSNNKEVVHNINEMAYDSSIIKSVPIDEGSHTIEYPLTVIQSPVIDIDSSKKLNHTKSYRNIPDSFRDAINSQGSEDHFTATNKDKDVSFESTGPEHENSIYDSMISSHNKFKNKVPANHKITFADLSGLQDEDVDKYRAENNLRNIDSPLLYLKPSAPNKESSIFLSSTTTLEPTSSEYEVYDEISTTISPFIKQTAIWGDSSSNFHEEYLEQIPQKGQLKDQHKIVQIIIPYTIDPDLNKDNLEFTQSELSWQDNKEEYQARKVPTVTEDYNNVNTKKTNYVSFISTTDKSTILTESERVKTSAILNDLYDVKEPPFDIIRLQHNIDDWTEQEYANHQESEDKLLPLKYAKKIPNEYFTTNTPIFSYDVNDDKNNEYYDHEGSHSMHHTVITQNNFTTAPNSRQYKTIDTFNKKHKKESNGNGILDDNHKLYIYTAASSFRTNTTTTTTPIPWSELQTSISPLTKEKIYVVTSKPWRESTNNLTNEWFSANFEPKRTTSLFYSYNQFSDKSNIVQSSPMFNANNNNFQERSDNVFEESSNGTIQSEEYNQMVTNSAKEEITTTEIADI